MTTARKLLTIAAAILFAYAWFAAFAISLTGFSVAMALSMVCLVANGCVRYVQRGQNRIGGHHAP